MSITKIGIEFYILWVRDFKYLLVKGSNNYYKIQYGSKNSEE